MQNYKVGDFIELTTERMSFGPAAVGRMEGGIVVFVMGATPKEKVRARITKIHKNYYDAEIVEILKKSTHRVEPKCSVFNECGGCQWQHIQYSDQVEFKKEILLHQIHKTTRLDLEKLRSLTKTHAAPHPYGYRARIQVRAENNQIGFFKPGTRSLVDVEKCEVAHPKIQKKWAMFKREELEELQNEYEKIKIEWALNTDGSISQAINREHAAHGFTQVNPEQNEIMQNIVREISLTSKNRFCLFDLYGGDGNLSQKLEKDFETIFTVDAFNHGVTNTQINSTEKKHWIVHSRVDDFLKSKIWSKFGYSNPDLIIADPSRSGLEEDAIKISKLNAENIIIVSCEPSKLSRDLMPFLKTYEIRKIDLVDMFPQTYHIESIVHLSKINA